MSVTNSRLPRKDKPQAEKPAPPPVRKDEDGEEKALQFLRSAKGELQGMRMVHMHLSLLTSRDPGHVAAIKRILSEIGAKASFFQLFSLCNHDILLFYKGLKLASVTEICQQVERLLLTRGTITGLNPYREQSVYSILELSLNFINVMRFVESIQKKEGATVEEETKPPITLEEMGRLERTMSNFDLSPFLFNQPVVWVGKAKTTEQEYFELYISIKQLQDRLCPSYDLAANRWLFTYFTANLDQSVLRALTHGMEFMRGRRVGININLSSVISTGFIKFDERLHPSFRNNMILEINKGDVIENLDLYFEVLDYAKDRKYHITIDALTPFLLASLDMEYLGAGFAKMFWSADMETMDSDVKAVLTKRIAEQPRCKFILARCDSVNSLVFAQELGIDYVQGRAVDNILRKGVGVRDAILAAQGYNESSGL